jgi:hypothetical protein
VYGPRRLLRKLAAGSQTEEEADMPTIGDIFIEKAGAYLARPAVIEQMKAIEAACRENPPEGFCEPIGHTMLRGYFSSSSSSIAQFLIKNADVSSAFAPIMAAIVVRRAGGLPTKAKDGDPFATQYGSSQKGQVAGIIAVKPEGDKASRMAVASAKIEAGQVYLPKRAAWLPELEAELFSFPGSRHDDQCDSISQAVLDKNLSFMDWLTPADWERLLARSRIPGRWALSRDSDLS